MRKTGHTEDPAGTLFTFAFNMGLIAFASGMSVAVLLLKILLG